MSVRPTDDAPVRELAEITGVSDTRDVLAHATRQAAAGHDDYFIVDIDAHVSEDHFWSEVIDLGDISGARGMEGYLLLWLSLWSAVGTLDFNIKVVR